MKKKIITYGVSGMMEYQAVIKVGKKNVSINFSDGSMSAMGTNPATFTTDNIIIQNAIEASNDYKRGRIAIVSTIVLDEELPILRNTRRQAFAEEKALPEGRVLDKKGEENEPGEPVSDGTPDYRPADAERERLSPDYKPALQDGNLTTDRMMQKDGTETDGEAEASVTEVEFSCNDDAKDYLEQTFGFVRSKLRNREDIVKAGKAHGVEIFFV